MYQVGDKVVYPHHGAGTIVKKEERDDREYLTIQIIHNDMTVMIPSDSADRAGLRKVIGEDTVEEVLGVLGGDDQFVRFVGDEARALPGRFILLERQDLDHGSQRGKVPLLRLAQTFSHLKVPPSSHLGMSIHEDR